MPFVGEIAALVSALTWGLTTVVVRAESRRLDVLLHNALRSSFGSVYTLALLGGLAVLGLHTPRLGGDWLLGVTLLILSVVLMVGGGDSLYFLAVARIGVARAMPVSMSFPLITTILAVALLGERVSAGLVAGLVLIPFGLYLVTLPARGRVVFPKSEPRTLWVGLGLALIAATLWAISSVIVRPALDQVDVLSATGIRSLGGAGSVWVLVWGSGRLAARTRLTRTRLGVAALGGLLNTSGSLLFIYAIQQAGAARTATLTATAPLFALPLSVLWLDEQVTRRQVAGTVLVVAGLMLVVGF